MNDIIKVILLNFILIYFLIKKNKSVSMFLIVVLFIYLLYLRANKLLEGQTNIDEKKDEVKFMKMVNLDRLLGKLLNVYEYSEEDCIGGYSEFSPCDKKCGITHKYKTYVVERKAGLFGKSCIEEDGRRKKELCDESDGVYKCIIGESCQEDGDCDSNNCDPKTDRCVPKKVCSNTNLDLCNKEECIDLNNHYDYTKREFKYDEAEPGVKCKLEDKETDTETEDEEEDDEELGTEYDPDKISLEQCDSEGNFWLYKDEDRTDTLTSVECKLKIPGSVYYADESDERLRKRNQIYGTPLDNQMGPGLYCKIGYQFDPDFGNNLKGVTQPIESEDLEGANSNTLRGYCTVNYYDNSMTLGDEVLCSRSDGGGYWPPLKYFTDLNNLGKDEQDIIPITEMCSRCKNGYSLNGEICTSCGSDIRNNYNQWVQDEDGKYERPPDSTIDIGKNALCNVGDSGSSGPLQDTCENLQNNLSVNCESIYAIPSFPTNTYVSADRFFTDCCTYCDNNKYLYSNPLDDSVSCKVCEAGKIQNTLGMRRECIYCPYNTYRPSGSLTCSSCPGGQIPNKKKTKCGDYCYIYENKNCFPRTTLNESLVRSSEGKCKVVDDSTNYFGLSGATDRTYEVEWENCSLPYLAMLGKDINDPNSLDFYEECCQFKCPDNQYDLGNRICGSISDIPENELCSSINPDNSDSVCIGFCNLDGSGKVSGFDNFCQQCCDTESGTLHVRTFYDIRNR